MSTTSSDFAPSKLEDLNVTQDELNNIGEALKKEEFRKLLCDYVQEIQNPENRKIYEEELTLLEKQRGVDVTFVTPKACFVVKTSSNGNIKTFINICSNENIGTPTSTKQKNGLNWKVPYILTPPRPDYDRKHQKCTVYDVVFHPQSIDLGSKSKDFKQLLLDTALNGVEQNFKVSLDKINLKFPNFQFKGSVHPTVLRRKSESASTSQEEIIQEDDLLQRTYSQNNGPKTEHNIETNCENLKPNSVNRILINKTSHNGEDLKLTNGKSQTTSDVIDPLNTPLNFPYPQLKEKKEIIVTNLDSNRTPKKEYASPNYLVKEYNEVSLDNYRNDKFCKSNITIPSKLIVEIKLPLLKTMEFTKLNIQGKQFEFVSEKPSKYKLNVMLPYTVDDENGNARFEVDKKLLVVTLPVVYKTLEKDNDEGQKKCDSENKIESRFESRKNFVDTKITQGNPNEHISSALENSSNDEAAKEIPTKCSTSFNKAKCTNHIYSSTKHKMEKVQENTSSKHMEINDNNVVTMISSSGTIGMSEEQLVDKGTSLKPKVLIEELENILPNGVEKSVSMDKNISKSSEEKNGIIRKSKVDVKSEEFFKSNVHYTYPEHVVNASENGTQLVFVFHVNNVERETVYHVLIDETTLLLQFVSVGNGFYRSQYGLRIRLTHSVRVKSISTGQNNVILKLTHTGCVNSCYYVTNAQGGQEQQIHIPEPEFFMDTTHRVPQVSNQEPLKPTEPSSEQKAESENLPETLESMNLETRQSTESTKSNIQGPVEVKVVGEKLTQAPVEFNKVDKHTQHPTESCEVNAMREMNSNVKRSEAPQSTEKFERKADDDHDKENQKTRMESNRMDIPKSKSTSSLSENGQQYRVRGILKTCSRSLSISSDEEDDDHYSSSCSVKKHVRFDEHISRKLFSTKYTILEQEKKYQKRLRHLSHKRERRASETEASDTETSKKHLSKKQQKKQNRQARNASVSNGGLETSDCVTETSEEESRSCSATSESGETSGDSDSGRGCSGEGGSVNVLASRKGHRRRGKKNARRLAADAKVDRGVFMMDVNCQMD